jgi:uncharacterized protein
MAFLPQRATIEAYGSGGFRFAHLSHVGGLLILPSGMHPWPEMDIASLTASSFAGAFAELDEIDFLLLGTGADMVPPPGRLLTELATRGLQVDWMTTGAAVRTYNVVLAEKRRVAAALLPVAAAHE